MSEENHSYDQPQDTGMPEQVESDPAALTSAEDLADVAGGSMAEEIRSPPLAD
jgi:hypothetical protein